LTVIAATTVLPPKPPSPPLVEVCAVKPNVLAPLFKFAVGVNFRPAFPCA
jgi:hypothetical protein